MKNSFFNRSINKVNNKELKESLEVSLMHNENALDYIKNNKNRLNDLLKYNSNNITAKDELIILEYIEFVLKHTGCMYEDNLKRLN